MSIFGFPSFGVQDSICRNRYSGMGRRYSYIVLRLCLVCFPFDALFFAVMGRGDNDVAAKRAKIIAETLKALDGYILQEQRATSTDEPRGSRGKTLTVTSSTSVVFSFGC